MVIVSDYSFEFDEGEVFRKLLFFCFMEYNVTRKFTADQYAVYKWLGCKFTADQYAVYKWLGCKYCPSLKMRRAFFYKGAEYEKDGFLHN